MISPTIRMRLVQSVVLAGRWHHAGAVVALSLDIGRHLLHLRRATPADPADLGRLQAAP